MEPSLDEFLELSSNLTEGLCGGYLDIAEEKVYKQRDSSLHVLHMILKALESRSSELMISFKHITTGRVARATAIQIPKTIFVVISIGKKIIGCSAFHYLEIEIGCVKFHIRDSKPLVPDSRNSDGFRADMG